MTHALLLALLSLFPTARAYRHRIEASQARIEAEVDAATAAEGVPVSLFLVVGYMETHLGTDHGEGGGYGAPVNVRHRHTAGTARHAARALARSFAICGSWVGAVARFRSGLCVPWQREHLKYVAMVVRRVNEECQRAELAVPDGFPAQSPFGTGRARRSRSR